MMSTNHATEAKIRTITESISAIIDNPFLDRISDVGLQKFVYHGVTKDIKFPTRRCVDCQQSIPTTAVTLCPVCYLDITVPNNIISSMEPYDPVCHRVPLTAERHILLLTRVRNGLLSKVKDSCQVTGTTLNFVVPRRVHSRPTPEHETMLDAEPTRRQDKRKKTSNLFSDIYFTPQQLQQSHSCRVLLGDQAQSGTIYASLFPSPARRQVLSGNDSVFSTADLSVVTNLSKDLNLDSAYVLGSGNKSRKPASRKAKRGLDSCRDSEADVLERKYGLATGDWYQRRKTHHHLHVPKIVYGGHVLRIVDGEKQFLCRRIAGQIRQIFQDPMDLTRFQYVIVPKNNYLSTVECVWEKKLLAEIEEGSRQLVKLPAKDITKTTGADDIYTLPSPEESHLPYAPQLHKVMLPDENGCTNRAAKNAAIAKFEIRYLDLLWVQNIKDFITEAMKIVHEFPIKPQRLLWKTWNIYKSSDYRWGWFHFCVVQIAMGQSDPTLKGPIAELFELPCRGRTGTYYDNPVAVCRNPSEVFLFFGARRTSKTKVDAMDDPMPRRNSPGITKSINRWKIKIRALILNAKKIVVQYVARLHKFGGTFLQKEAAVIRTYRLPKNVLKFGNLTPLPERILKMVPQHVDLFPAVFDEDYFLHLRGILIKSTNLIAEAVYDYINGPALDIHMERFVLSMGIVCGMRISGNSTITCRIIKETFGSEMCVAFNELPGSVSQILHKQVGANLVDDLRRLAKQFGPSFEYGIERFFHMYPPKQNSLGHGSSGDSIDPM